MSNCCIKNLGAIPHTQNLDTGLQAPDAGEYTARLFINGSTRAVKFSLEAGDDLIVPAPFNENFDYKMEVIAPDGTKISSYEGCTLFSFSTFVETNNNCSNGCDDDSEDAPYYS